MQRTSLNPTGDSMLHSNSSEEGAGIFILNSIIDKKSTFNSQFVPTSKSKNAREKMLQQSLVMYDTRNNTKKYDKLSDDGDGRGRVSYED
jgi:hypothetical protein